MLRLVRIILLGLLSLPLISLVDTGTTGLINVTSAGCSIFQLNCVDDTQINICNSNDPSSSKYCSLDK